MDDEEREEMEGIEAEGCAGTEDGEEIRGTVSAGGDSEHERD